MDKNRERVAEEFQDEYLKKYTHLSFEELKKMIGRENLPVQKGLEDFKFAIVISYDKGARSMEVGCFRYSDPPSFPKKFEEILDSADIKVTEISMGRWFNKYKNGNIEWPNYDDYDPED